MYTCVHWQPWRRAAAAAALAIQSSPPSTRNSAAVQSPVALWSHADARVTVACAATATPGAVTLSLRCRHATRCSFACHTLKFTS
jgi:hypothetical protein